MKLYTVTHGVLNDTEDAVLSQQTVWCASISDATKAYNEAEKHQPIIKIVTLPSGREEMAAWLNERGIKA